MEREVLLLREMQYSVIQVSVYLKCLLFICLVGLWSHKVIYSLFFFLVIFCVIVYIDSVCGTSIHVPLKCHQVSAHGPLNNVVIYRSWMLSNCKYIQVLDPINSLGSSPSRPCIYYKCAHAYLYVYHMFFFSTMLTCTVHTCFTHV